MSTRLAKCIAEVVAFAAACVVLLLAVPVFALVFFITLDEPPTWSNL